MPCSVQGYGAGPAKCECVSAGGAAVTIADNIADAMWCQVGVYLYQLVITGSIAGMVSNWCTYFFTYRFAGPTGEQVPHR